jgi:hypothetical protein
MSTLLLSSPLVPSLALILGGLALAIGFGHALWLGGRSLQWIPVKAVILESGVPRFSLFGGEGWRARVRFSYEFDGETYESRRTCVSPAVSHSDVRDAGEDADRYRAGQSAIAYVDPARPSYAVLDPGPQLSHGVAAAIGAGCVLLGILTATGTITL